MKRIVVGSVVVLLIAAAIAWWLFSPQVIRFDNGIKLTLLGVDYGKRHSPPARQAGTRRRGNGSFTTPDNVLVAWIKVQHKPDTSPDFTFSIQDKTGAGVEDSDQNSDGPNREGVEIIGVECDAFPRRQEKVYLGVQYYRDSGAVMAKKRFIIRNPARGPFPAWTAEPLPSTKTDDDFSVTLTKLTYDPPGSDDGNVENQNVHVTFHTERDGKPVDNWRPVSIVTSDATGNHINGSPSEEQWKNGDGTFDYQYGLWPDEPAWKMLIEFSQESDFSDKELWAVRDLPIEPATRRDFWNIARDRTNAPAAETTIDGFHLKLTAVKRFTDVPQGSGMQGGFVIQVDPALPDGEQLTLVEWHGNADKQITLRENGHGVNRKVAFYRYMLQDLTDVTNLNLAVAVHKSRYVTFTAKPVKAPLSENTDN